MQLNLAVNSSKTSLLQKFERKENVLQKSRTIYDPVHGAPATSTRVFYISAGVCCAVVFLVVIILAVLHLNWKTASVSSSSQGLSQPCPR